MAGEDIPKEPEIPQKDSKMSDDSADSDLKEEKLISIFVKAAQDKKYSLKLPVSLTVLELKTKLAQPEYANIPVSRQQLIYSGRVLKPGDTLESVKLKDGNSIHLIKGADSNARQNPSATGSGSIGSGLDNATSRAPTATPNLPPSMAAGVGMDPFAALTGARYAGFHGLQPNASIFGPDGGMGAPPDAATLQRLLEDPAILSQMSEFIDSPAFIHTLENAPGFRNNPMYRDLLRNPETRRMMTDPNMIRSMLELHRALGSGSGAGSGGLFGALGGFGGLGGADPFPAPGVADLTPLTTAPGDVRSNSDPGLPAHQPATGNVGGGVGAEGTGAVNTLAAALLAQQARQAQQQTQIPGERTSDGTASSTPTPGLANENMNNPLLSILNRLMTVNNHNGNVAGITNPGDGAANPALSAIPAAAAAAQLGHGLSPSDNTNMNQLNLNAMMESLFGATGGGTGNIGAGTGVRGAGTGAVGGGLSTIPPEERYASQLRQLNDMGFYDFDRNIEALRRSGGSVEGAIERLLGGEGTTGSTDTS